MKKAFNLCFLIILLSTSAICHEKLMASSFRVKVTYDAETHIHVNYGTAFGADLSDWNLKGKHYLLTANHVVGKVLAQTPDISIEVKEGQWEKARIVAQRPELDLAILSIEKEVPTLKLADRDIQTEQDIMIAGAANGEKVRPFKGKVVSRYEFGSILSKMEIRLDFGDSGSAVLCLKNDRVVGVLVAGLQKKKDLDKSQALFVPISVVSAFLDEVKKQLP